MVIRAGVRPKTKVVGPMSHMFQENSKLIYYVPINRKKYERSVLSETRLVWSANEPMSFQEKVSLRRGSSSSLINASGLTLRKFETAHEVPEVYIISTNQMGPFRKTLLKGIYRNLLRLNKWQAIEVMLWSTQYSFIKLISPILFYINIIQKIFIKIKLKALYTRALRISIILSGAQLSAVQSFLTASLSSKRMSPSFANSSFGYP